MVLGLEFMIGISAFEFSDTVASSRDSNIVSVGPGKTQGLTATLVERNEWGMITMGNVTLMTNLND